MKKYDTYKDSGVEWIGRLPEHWNILKFKHCTDINNGRDFKDFQIDEGGYPVLGTGGEFARASKFIYDGEAILLGRKGTIDKPYYFIGKFWAVDTIFYCIPHNDKCGKFIYYQALNFPFDLYSTATALPSMTQTDIANIQIAAPPLSEQKKIAEYLDYKVGQIDALIADKEAQVDDMQKYRQSLISETVTRGLNPDVPLKDSGIEWIGNIPQHWEVKKIKNNFNIFAGSTPNSEVREYWENGQIAWITPADYKTEDKYVSSGNKCITQAGYDSCSTTLVPAGSIIFSKRAPIGTVALSANELCTNQGCLSCVAKADVNSAYFYYVFSVYTNVFEMLGSGSTFLEISMNAFSNVQFMTPSLSEQQEIAEYLDEKTSQIADIITNLHAQIADLKSYKASLINEAVTGKIDLRTWAKPQND